MDGMTEARLEQLLSPYFVAPVLAGERNTAPATQVLLGEIVPRLRTYLELLLRWNQRTNLTAIRSPEGVVTRHFGESLFAARVLANYVKDGDAVLDIGSGAGFPGLPLQLLLPKLRVTLAESQGKKAAFLREAMRATEAGAEVWASRVQMLPPDRRFDTVTLRAVDSPQQAVEEGKRRVRADGWLLQMIGTPEDNTKESGEGLLFRIPALANGFVSLSQMKEAYGPVFDIERRTTQPE